MKENITTMRELNNEITRLRLNILAKEKLLGNHLEKLPGETVKASAGVAIPLIIRRLVSTTSTNILGDAFNLLFSRKRGVAKKAIGGTIKRFGLITLLKSFANSYTKKKFSSSR